MPEPTKRADRAEIAKYVERAEKLLQKGKTAEALDVYLQILVFDPENDTVRQMAADLCLSLQRTTDAVRLLGELFDRQIESGDATRASLTYKKLARFVNPTWEQKARFGQLLENSNRKLAVETYENALEELTRQARKTDSLMVLRRIVGLEPNERNLLRLGELAAEIGDSRTAATSFLQLAELTQANAGNAAPWYERAYGEDPSDVEIALAYARSLLAQEQVGAAIFVLEPHVTAGAKSPELRETFAKALISARRLTEAEPLLWQIFEQNPSRINEITNLIGLLLDGQQDTEAVALARKLEQYQRRKGERRTFTALMQDIAANHRASPEMLEFMSELFNASNREADYSQTLLKLYDLHFGMGNFAKAAECLDRAAEVDPYETGHQKRLESLHGKIDENRYRVIASRFTSASTSTAKTAQAEEPVLGAAALQDLMLQAEILVQYGMRSKAIERLQRIQELFPKEEERNEDLHRLYLAVGLNPRSSSGTAPKSSAPAATAGEPAREPAPASVSEAADVTSLTRVAEITRKLYRQGNADAVMTTAANEIGSQWKLHRCLVATRKPGLPPTAVKEFCAEGVAAGDSGFMGKLVSLAQDLAVSRGSLVLSDAVAAAELQPVREVLAPLGVGSLLALPLTDGQEQMGVLVLVSNGSRVWRSSDIVVLKTLAEQVVIALNNAGLRRLVKNLSVTDENSGLLKRASYLDLLMAETRRALQQSTPLTVVLMQFGKRSTGKDTEGALFEGVMEQIGQLFSANIRQNDLAFRYGATTIALILGETAEKEANFAVEKLRKLVSEMRLPEKDVPVTFATGMAEAVMRPVFDPVDIVTEVINRAESALDMAMAQGPGKVVGLAASFATAAVA
ncbi:MAG: tetratricopeptide repeat protein [Acidobacteria bacterium]|nr:tetratricopeptide repeat protein [Acidobacteriota bacterium]